ncbi:MAG: DNA-binding protein [Gammaproteobacteria bacterium]|nr:DNA-binding protein [Gammaproteobacteria bacterium]
MAQTKLLLDSNAYFRLAKEIHPLLFQEFGSKAYCLYVLQELEAEYDRSRRLQTKFPWVDAPEYRANRCKPLTLSKRQRADITISEGIMWEAVLTEVPGPTRVDVRNLAHGYVLGVPVVTDDADMATLARMFHVQITSTLQLLKLMLDQRHVTMQDIRRIAGFWRWLGDVPRDFVREYKKIFNEAPPN